MIRLRVRGLQTVRNSSLHALDDLHDQQGSDGKEQERRDDGETPELAVLKFQLAEMVLFPLNRLMLHRLPPGMVAGRVRGGLGYLTDVG